MDTNVSPLPEVAADVARIDVAGILITIGVGVAVWLIASFIIVRITRRVASGSTLFKKPHFRWVAPALRALDHERRAQRAETIGSLLNSVVGVVIVTIVIIYVLKYLNVDITPLLTSVGILGVAIGFGAQQLIRDFLAGIFITIEDQYGIGDVIETSEVVGTVESVGLRITRVRANDGAIWYLRNGEILRVGNRSQGDYVPPSDAESQDESQDEDEPKVAPPLKAASQPAEAAAPASQNPVAKHPDQKASE
ncbi:mechanosensitive ion channel family protein [Arthrobacter sp. ISL-30]|uniref:mechanosensitive ion channel family protein n=1 Tax=Arthrobacter sp. ISL-30 TaxID=2819109 RepID=UPI001BED3323|nr:mechanosensitive ion channel domain-containing protein [Arthrobacter sp. ISL-30]MBT2513590.1 mechanosensitive ion channel [Arthrobacter sp. ISL-30]